MKEFKQPKLKGIDDLNDPRYSYKNIISSELITERNKSKEGREKSKQVGKNNVENGVFGGKGSMSQNALDESGWYGSEKHMQVWEANRDPDAGWKALKEQGYYETEKYKKHQKLMTKKAHESLKANDGYKPFNEAGIKKSHEKTTCIHCGEPGDQNNITRWHNDNCKEKPEVMNKILNLLPNEFTQRQWTDAFKKIGHKANTGHILGKGKYAIKIHEGKYGSRIDVSIYKKITKTNKNK